MIGGASSGYQLGSSIGGAIDASIAPKVEASFQASNEELTAHYKEYSNYAEGYTKTIANNDPVGGQSANDAIDKASVFANKMGFKETDALLHDDDIVNAYQHQYWQASLRRERGWFVAKMYGNLHEATSRSALQTTMDLGNNAIGRHSARLKGNLYDVVENNILSGNCFTIYDGTLIYPRVDYAAKYSIFW